MAWWPCAVAGGDAHAGRTETSLALALLPERVRTERAQAGERQPVGALMGRLRTEGVAGVSRNGVLGDPAGASAAEGRVLVAQLAQRLRRAVERWQVGDDGRLLP